MTSSSFHRPRAPLSTFVDFFWIYEGYAAPHRREQLMPNATLDVVFTIDANGRALSGVSGARSKAFLLDTSQPFSAIGIHFRPGGGFPFFGIPAGELHNQTVSLDTLWGRLAAAVSEQLWLVPTSEARFRVLEHALLEQARGHFCRHPAIVHAIGLFDRSYGALSVGSVVQRVGLSQRRFVELFWNEVGLSPKRFCRVRRFNDVLRRIEPLTDVDWTELSLACGYFDQAHFNHDFRALAGMSPSEYLRRRVARNHVRLAD
jgi:AraC-like DNA-binding protein